MVFVAFVDTIGGDVVVAMANTNRRTFVGIDAFCRTVVCHCDVLGFFGGTAQYVQFYGWAKRHVRRFGPFNAYPVVPHKRICFAFCR